jgi:hypothetical protein
VKYPLAALALTALAGVAAWQGAMALQNESSASAPAAETSAPAPNEAPAASSAADTRRAPNPPQAAMVKADTPMADRIATIGILNKRNGLWRDLTLKPGQAVRLGDLIVRLRACEATAPWEPEKLTGAFVQADVLGRDTRWRRIFSGWLYKESPSLNVVEHPIYDVWPKSCAMRHPDVGPETVSITASDGGSKRSSAKKSAGAATDSQPAPEPAETPSAPSSNDT